MTTLLITQSNYDRHVTPQGHPERAERMKAVARALEQPKFGALKRETAPSGDLSLAEIAHSEKVMNRIRAVKPAEGLGQIDEDTFVSASSLDASATALGGVMRGIEAVVMGEADNVFVAARPPGHHAERNRSMGFCLINTIAIAARQAQRLYGAERIAIIDFDVHHGNGTQDIFEDDPSVFYASSHQMPLYPFTGAPEETGVGNIVNAALKANTGGEHMREAYRERILPALENFAPDLLLISAGFDAEKRDPLAQLEWVGSDYAWLTGKLMDIAEKRCSNRIVSMLEGGYDLGGLASGVAAHIGMLLSGTAGSDSESEQG